ncbi:MAG: TIGR02206 family membrane protein, partial [Candidatus Marinimicrobia bacterium]|nr:TIGR02206 family membrane protein [Candidatus Neomarinimicrobiota bacterium]
KIEPTLKGLKNSFIGLNLFLLISFIANILLDANYFWIMEKPPMSSILDYLGPWPWYILFAEFVALAHFILAYFIFILIKKYLTK